MSRRPASRLAAPIFASLAALALTACGGGHDAPAPPPVAASTPEVTPQQAPVPASTESAPEQKPPESAASAPAAPSPPPATTETSLPGDAPPAPAPAPAQDPNVKPVEKPVDALQWLQDSEARRADYQRRVSQSEADVAIANASVADWERTSLAFKNPFLARPKLSPEDAQTIAAMNGAERVRWADGRLGAARAVRDAAQKNLAALKANPPEN
jgi:hypothetical protein